MFDICKNIQMWENKQQNVQQCAKKLRKGAEILKKVWKYVNEMIKMENMHQYI